MYKPEIGKEEEEEILKVVRSGWISSASPVVREFEEKFSNYIGRRYGVATSNGTTALHLAVTALGIKEGDEVIVPDLTFVSPVNVVLYNKAKPVLVDIEEENWGLDPEKVRKVITDKTKAIIVVHLYGNPAKITELKEIAEEKGLYLIEDCAEAHGAEYEGKKVGSFGDISCFSFYANKIITTGEGGMCITDSEELYEKMQILRDHGMTKEKRYWHEVIGYNYRMTGLQAALGLAQLRKIDNFIRRKREIAKLYQDLLGDVVIVQRDPPKGKSIFWLFSVFTEKRDRLVEYLGLNGIETRKFFYPVHVMSPYTIFAYEKRFDISTKLSSLGLNLPSYPSLTIEEINYISTKIKEIIRN
ncbi:DegT/DnrJ/EryC1/StrS family aminotransferase [Sulfurisphaera ohwakuensis]|uniref:DegT/DnrJ/EryC1/StrS family aminotransferase n=1 Tax=Sulfurisphaera ohwakuensis TaxID=69656 RepID=UPI0036F29E13